MRISPRKALTWLVGFGLLQAAVYYWSVSKNRRRSKVGLKPAPVISPLKGEDGTCTFQNCPKVEEGMLNIHLVPHSHIDVGWLKTVDQYYTGAIVPAYFNGRECVRCTLNTTISELLKNPNRRFIFVEMKYFSRYWNEIDDKLREKVRQLIKERRLELVNGGWVMSDAGVTTYNDIIDQHTLGFDFIRDTFGPCAQSRTGWHVDQFGHSREHASIFAQMGYDSLFIGRIDYQDHIQRKKTKNLELIWETSQKNFGRKSTLFTQTTFDGYYAPANFVFDNQRPDVFTDPHATYTFIKIMEERARSFRTNHLLVPMGSDFGYREARLWFSNMDKLIEQVKEQRKTNAGLKVNFLYSTPSCYTYYVNRENKTFETKHDDFMPYATEPGHYWTGYFTTRGGMKMHLRKAGQVLQSCKQLSIFTGLTGSFHTVQNLRDIVGVMQHHDAITGTQKKHVLQDYNKLMSAGIARCQSVINLALHRLWSASGVSVLDTAQLCPDLNVSSCSVSEGKDPFLITVYNPLSWAVDHWVRFPVSFTRLTITDHKNGEVPYQLSSVPSAVRAIPERTSHTDVEAVFLAKLPPMSVSSFKVKTERGDPKPTSSPRIEQQDTTIENEFLALTFNGKTGLLERMLNKASQQSEQVHQNFVAYQATSSGTRFSGAYVFVPNPGGAKPISNKAEVRVFRGPLVQEVHQQFSPWVSQVVRLYKGAKYAELQWVVGPIPTENSGGTEVVSHFNTSLKNGNAFFTDSNGREMMRRIRNFRETWDLQIRDEVAGNYYPVTSRMHIVDNVRNVQLTILPDRPQGGGSIKNGTMEIMVHRKLRYDDGLGVGEPLNDEGVDNQGIRFTGKHYLFLDTVEESVKLARVMGMEVHLAPTYLFTAFKDDVPPSALTQHVFLREGLPPSVQVLTLDRISLNETNIYLLRLEHMFEKNDHSILSVPAVVKLETLFQPFDIVSVEETTLGGNFHPDDISRLTWMTDKGLTQRTIGSINYKHHMIPPFDVVLQPMEIRTFRVQVVRDS